MICDSVRSPFPSQFIKHSNKDNYRSFSHPRSTFVLVYDRGLIATFYV